MRETLHPADAGLKDLLSPHEVREDENVIHDCIFDESFQVHKENAVKAQHAFNGTRRASVWASGEVAGPPGRGTNTSLLSRQRIETTLLRSSRQHHNTQRPSQCTHGQQNWIRLVASCLSDTRLYLDLRVLDFVTAH